MPTRWAGFSFVSAKCIEIYTILILCFCAFRCADVKLYKNKYNPVGKLSVLPIDGGKSKCYLFPNGFMFLKRGMHDDESDIHNGI